MGTQKTPGFLILDRKGEYFTDTVDQRGNSVPGLYHHPRAVDRMVILSMRDFSRLKREGQILDFLRPQFSIRDIDPVDLADFLTSFTSQQANIIRDYAHVHGFYDFVLAETRFGRVDKRDWFKAFPGIFEFNEKGKKVISELEKQAEEEDRDELTDADLDQLQDYAGGTKHGVLERAAASIKRFCMNPFFGGSARGPEILSASSCLPQILTHLQQGKLVFVDMRGRSDDEYTMIAALFARRLLTDNKGRDDSEHIRACIVMEEAHNILSEAELTKGNGSGSVFVELAREGRSFKLGFVLVTQQPDARSIAPQVVKTIDTVVAFNMPPDDARHLQRLKSAFADLELEISNTPEFHGVAVADAGPVPFRSSPVDVTWMRRSASGELELMIKEQAPEEAIVAEATEPAAAAPTIEERLAQLMRQRQEQIQPVALATMQAWRTATPAVPNLEGADER